MAAFEPLREELLRDEPLRVEPPLRDEPLRVEPPLRDEPLRFDDADCARPDDPEDERPLPLDPEDEPPLPLDPEDERPPAVRDWRVPLLALRVPLLRPLALPLVPLRLLPARDGRACVFVSFESSDDEALDDLERLALPRLVADISTSPVFWVCRAPAGAHGARRPLVGH